jgi:dihydrofolate synthase/folylpolyglutamate synthase
MSMNFPEAFNYLYRLGHEMLAMELGLESVRALANAFENPQQKFPAVHIAGTNGKGSTAAMVAAIARAAGLRTGLYTSPHLVSITERVRVDGAAISEEDFARLATAVRATSEGLVKERVFEAPPTFFEQVTMIAFLYFVERAVDLAVLEVGLGGRLDATNICAPVVTAITPVDFDHQKQLGNTLREIAGEKAGILKTGVPVVVAPQADEAMAAIETRAAAAGAPLIAAPSDVDAELMEAGGDLWQAGRHRIRRGAIAARLALRGRHQLVNAATAIAIAESLRAKGFPLTDEAIAAGLEGVEWPGRLEMLRAPGSTAPLLLDGAHNPAGGRALGEFLRAFCAAHPITLVFAAMADKAIGELARELFPLAARLVITRADNPRAAPPQTIADAAATLGCEAICCNTVAEAMAEAVRLTPADGLICASGSLFLVGEVQAMLK